MATNDPIKLEGEMQDDGDFVVSISKHSAHVEKYILTVWHGQTQLVKLRGLSLAAFSVAQEVAESALASEEEDESEED